jgi:gliding motility-associated-like protein
MSDRHWFVDAKPMTTHSVHANIKSILTFLIAGMSLILRLHAQSDCITSYAKAIGSVTETEKGYCLAAGISDDLLYVGGLRNDSVVILEVSATGNMLHTWTFDFIPGKADHLHGLIVDTEGKIVGLGGTESPQSGSGVFAFRFDPANHTMMWAKEYRSSFQNYSNGIFEIPNGGDFLMVNNPHMGSANDTEIVKLNRTSGAIDPAFSKHYHLGGSESLGDLVFHNGFLYSAGRFTDGLPNDKMRTTLVKIDPNSGDLIWTVLGHRPANAVARLYGVDMVIDNDTIYAISLGSPTTASLNNTQIYVQAFNLDGDLIWIKQYDLPGTNDWVDEIVSTGNGFLIMGRNRLPPSDIFVFKINHAGELLWANKYDFALNDNSVTIGGLQSQMLLLGESVFFTAAAEENGNADIILVKFSADGSVSDTCSSVTPANIPVNSVASPEFYNAQPQVSAFTPQAFNLQPAAKTQSFPVQDLCLYTPQILDSLSIRICQGEIFEGYTSSGVYTDHFTILDGCDSVRILTLDVSAVHSTSIQATICAGEVLEGYDTQGVYVDTFTGQNGCDSSRTLELFVFDTIRYVIDTTICLGESVEGYSISGTYTDAFVAINGCDSLRVLALTVQDHLESFLEIRICQGESFEGYTSAGLYTDVFVSSGGCDSLRTLKLEVGQVSETAIEASLCAGQHFEEYTTTGTYQDTFENVYGCDSIRTLELSILDPPLSYLKVSICDEAAKGYHTPGIYLDTLHNSDGCDSIRSLEIEHSLIYVPNVFSPNNDGVNDFFEIKAHPDAGMVPVYFAIFDRMGNMAYQREDDLVKWDGRDKSGKLYNPGVFTWILKWECQQEVKQLAGDVTLIR